MDTLQKSISSKKFALSALAFFALFTLSAKAGLPEKYGERFSNDGKVWYKVPLEANWTSAYSGCQYNAISYITYDSDGSVTWDWESIYDNGVRVKGVRIDEAGSFKVKTGDQIGFDAWHGTGINGYTYHINIYPMMRYDGMDILLTDWEDIIFRVSSDNTIRMECDKANIPTQAEIGFGGIETDYFEYNESDSEFYYGNYYYKKCNYGPSWQMYLDFSLIPLYANQDSLDEVINDSSEHDVLIYDIFGRRVDGNHPAPGIYICNGKKILIK